MCSAPGSSGRGRGRSERTAPVPGSTPSREPPAPMQRTQLGQILIELGLANEEQIAHFLNQQEQERPRRPLGEILVEHGMIDKRTLRFLLNQQRLQVQIDAPVEPTNHAGKPRPKSSWSEMTQRLGKGQLVD